MEAGGVTQAPHERARRLAGIMQVGGGVLAALWLGVQAEAAAAGSPLRYSALFCKKKTWVQ